MSDILSLIHNITANRESGRLEVLAGAIQGELSFADGKLVDARVGHLTGFRAVNAVVAMRDARFGFDPAFAPLASSSITPSEQVVLKQFFGIEAVAASKYVEPMAENWTEEAMPIEDAADEVTIVRSNARSAELPTPSPHVSRFTHRIALVFAALVIAVIAAAAVLIYRFHEPASQPAVAKIESPSAPMPEPKRDPVIGSTPVRDVSGKWNVVNTIDTTSYSSYKNMKIGFDLSIDQKGSTFTGNGRKVSENGRTLPAGSRTPIQVKGSINGDRIEATFFEDGAARKSDGRFVWRIDRAGRGLTGNFATTAARSSGRSSATREL